MTDAAGKTILVAVDGSPPSTRGLQLAAEMARGLGAQLELVFVSPPMLLPPTVYEKAIREIEAAEKTHAEALLSEAARVIEGTACTLVRLSGSPAETIAEHARDERYWGVVVGAKSHNALSRVMLGSVADRLCHICTRPVLIVR